MSVPPVELLERLRTMKSEELRIWAQDLLTNDRTTPDCPGPEDLAPHARLLDLCNYRGPEITLPLRVVQEQIRSETLKLCGWYRPSQDGAYLGLELLYFAQAHSAIDAIRPFGLLLSSRGFSAQDKHSLNLWLNAHWVVADMLQAWNYIEGWVVRDSDGETQAQSSTDVPPRVKYSAIGVWATYGVPTTFAHLILAILRLIPQIFRDPAPDDYQLANSLARYVSLLHARLRDAKMSFSSLLPNPFEDVDWGGYEPKHVWDCWSSFSDNFGSFTLISDLDCPLEDKPSAHAAMSRLTVPVLTNPQYA